LELASRGIPGKLSRVRALRDLIGRYHKNRFAQRVRDGLIAAGETRPVRYDEAAFALRIPSNEQDGPDNAVFLHNVFAAYRTSARRDRPKTFERIITSITEIRDPTPATFDAAADHLLPQVRPLSEQGLWLLHGQVDGQVIPESPYRVIAPGIAAWLAYDRPESMMRISASQIAKWGIDFDHAFTIAVGNLRARSAKRFAQVADGLYVSDWADKYDTSRILLTDVIGALAVRGAPVVMLPNRDVLLVTGSDDADGLRAMVDAARQILDQPRPLGAVALSLIAGEWHAFAPDATMPGVGAFYELQEVDSGRLYAEQKLLLDRLHEKLDRDIFVASHLIKRTDPGDHFLASLAIWAPNVDALLPRTQTLALGHRKRLITAPWDTVVQVAGEHLVPMGWWPERYRVRSFPSDDQIEALLGKPGVESRDRQG
jgi:hypothetical protein